MASIAANGAKGHHKFTLNVSEDSVDVDSNVSYVDFTFVLSSLGGGWNWEGWGSQISYVVLVNGERFSGSIPNYDGYSSVTLKTGSIEVIHEDDGSKSIGFSFTVTDNAGQYYTSGNASASGTMALTTIPMASTVSAVSGTTIGGQMTVTIARAASAFTHQLWYKVGNSAWYDLGKGIGTSKTFTIDIATANQFPNATSGTLQLRVRTYNGSTTIGSDTYHNVTVSVPSYTPTISNIKLTGNSLLSGEYVQGKSTVTVEITASSLYGATIKSFSSTVEGKTYTGSKFTSSALSSGSKSVSVTVTDTRGKTATLTSSTITVRSYANPTITEFSLARQSDETTVVATVKGSVASVNSKNAKTIQVTLNGVTQTITSSSYTISGTTTFTNVPTDNTFTSVAKIADSYTHVTREFVLPTVAVTMDFLHDGKGIAMGKVAETTGLLDVAWNAKVNGKLTVNGSTELNNPLTIIDDTMTILSLKRNSTATDATTSSMRFQNNSGTLGHIGMSGVNTGLKRWLADTSGAYLILDTGNTKDYVVEQATSGDWYYTKWNGGKAEAWRKVTIGDVALTTSMITGVWSNDTQKGRDISLPSGLFVSAPFAFSNATSSGYTITQVSNTTKDTISYRLWAPYSATVSNCIVFLYVIGRWK